VPGNADHGQLSQTQTFGGNLREDVSGCHPDFQSFILFFFYVYLLVSLLWLVYTVKPLYYFSSVLKSTSFTPNSFSQSFLSIPDLSSPSEIRTFRCYEGTAHKLRPSPFGTHLRSPEFVVWLPEPNSVGVLGSVDGTGVRTFVVNDNMSLAVLAIDEVGESDSSLGGDVRVVIRRIMC
jgi:hypothetical protein